MGVTWQTHSSVNALLGGLLLGFITVTRMAIVGKVTGISGMLNGSTIYKLDKVSFEERLQKIIFVLGISLGGLAYYFILPEAFLDWTSIPIERVIIGGILVGVGTTVGNGCTSGHGVCGISSFRIRSLVATCTFMTTGILTAIFTDSLKYYPEFDNKVAMSTAGICATIGFLVCACIYATGSSVSNGSLKFSEDQKQYFLLVTEFLMGAGFGLAMVIANMTMNNATLSFLDLTQWNPALAFIMGGAIAVSAPSFYYVQAKGSPFIMSKFDLPKSTDIDVQLISGAAIFGVGWGLCGVCPGPALTNLFNLQSGYYPFLFIISMIAGFWSKEVVFNLHERSSNYKAVESELSTAQQQAPVKAIRDGLDSTKV